MIIPSNHHFPRVFLWFSYASTDLLRTSEPFSDTNGDFGSDVCMPKYYQHPSGGAYDPFVCQNMGIQRERKHSYTMICYDYGKSSYFLIAYFVLHQSAIFHSYVRLPGVFVFFFWIWLIATEQDWTEISADRKCLEFCLRWCSRVTLLKLRKSAMSIWGPCFMH